MPSRKWKASVRKPKRAESPDRSKEQQRSRRLGEKTDFCFAQPLASSPKKQHSWFSQQSELAARFFTALVLFCSLARC